MQNEVLLEELKNQTVWLKTIALLGLRPILQEELKLQESRKVYGLSDGKRTTREIAKTIGVSHSKIERMWNRWASLGIVTPGKRRGRYKRII